MQMKVYVYHWICSQNYYKVIMISSKFKKNSKIEIVFASLEIRKVLLVQ